MAPDVASAPVFAGGWRIDRHRKEADGASTAMGRKRMAHRPPWEGSEWRIGRLPAAPRASGPGGGRWHILSPESRTEPDNHQ
jgi:hypothetical protein